MTMKHMHASASYCNCVSAMNAGGPALLCDRVISVLSPSLREPVSHSRTEEKQIQETEREKYRFMEI